MELLGSTVEEGDNDRGGGSSELAIDFTRGREEADAKESCDGTSCRSSRVQSDFSLSNELSNLNDNGPQTISGQAATAT
jgi:hypothetical protein